jgi:hypothetical protein
MVRKGKNTTFSFRLSSRDSQSMKNKSRAKKPASRKASGSGELRRDAEEVALLEGRWKILGDATPPTIRPKKIPVQYQISRSASDRHSSSQIIEVRRQQ